MAYKITALTQQKRNRQRVNVYLDGEYAFGLARIVAAWLEVGQELSAEKIARLKEEDGREMAYQRALNLLSYRPRTQAEIRKKLEEHEFSEADIAYTLERLQRSGLLDDAAFARAWVDNRNEMRPRGRRALSFELRRKGVAPEVIEQTLEAIDEEQLAYRAAQKRARRYKTLDFQGFRKKMYSHLVQRGFGYDAIGAVVERVWQEGQDTNPSEEESL